MQKRVGYIKKSNYQLVPTISGLPTGHHWKVPPSVLFAVFLQVFLYIDEILMSLLFSQLCQSFSRMKSVPYLTHFCGPSAMWPLQSLVFHFSLYSFANTGIFVSIFLKTKAFQPVKLLHYFPVRRSRKIIFSYRCSDDSWSCDVQHPFPNGFEIGQRIQLFHTLHTSKPCPKPSIKELKHI